MAYLTLEEFKVLSVIPRDRVDEIEAVEPGFTEAQLNYWSTWIDSRLRKRYAAPFKDGAVPAAVKGWLARIVTVRVMLRRGVDPNDEQFAEIKRDDADAREEIKEAADAELGLFDLPTLVDPSGTGASAITAGTPYAYSEQSPYVGADEAARLGHMQDQARRGSGL